MERLNHEPVINHFSHPHPLRLSNLQFPSQTPPCSACNHHSSGWMYSCNHCNFSLHLSCAQLPSLITHPSHPIHSLTLLSTPAYYTRAFTCNGCRQIGLGFNYHCNYCSFDLHTSCAHMECATSSNNSSTSTNAILQHSYSIPALPRPLPMQQPVYLDSPSLGAGYPPRPVGSNNGIMNRIVQGLFIGAVQVVGGAIVHGIIGGDW